jgi:hypothetical protein
MKLSLKLPLIFLLLSLVPLVVVRYLGYDSSRQVIEQQILNHLISTASLKQAELNRWIDASQHQLRVLAARPQVREFTGQLANLDPADPTYQTIYQNLKTDHLIGSEAFIKIFG